LALSIAKTPRFIFLLFDILSYSIIIPTQLYHSTTIPQYPQMLSRTLIPQIKDFKSQSINLIRASPMKNVILKSQIDKIAF
jgi:hypothetical protein